MFTLHSLCSPGQRLTAFVTKVPATQHLEPVCCWSRPSVLSYYITVHGPSSTCLRWSCQAPHAVLTYPFACGRAAAAGIAARAGPLLRRAAVAQWEARLRIAGGGAWRLVASSPTGEELAFTRVCSRYDGSACLGSPTSCHHGADGNLMGRTSVLRLSFCPLNRHSTLRQQQT